MDLPTLALVALLAVALGGASLLAITRGQALDRVKGILGVGPAGDVDVAARAVIQGRDSAVWAARTTKEELAHVINLIGSGIVRLDDHLVVSMANEAADAFL